MKRTLIEFAVEGRPSKLRIVRIVRIGRSSWGLECMEGFDLLGIQDQGVRKAPTVHDLADGCQTHPGRPLQGTLSAEAVDEEAEAILTSMRATEMSKECNGPQKVPGGRKWSHLSSPEVRSRNRRTRGERLEWSHAMQAKYLAQIEHLQNLAEMAPEFRKQQLKKQIAWTVREYGKLLQRIGSRLPGTVGLL